MPPVPAVRLENLVKTYGDVRAVDGVDLNVPNGAFVTLLGPSGCGKTTTLRMIAGFEQPDQGEVYIHGTQMGTTPPHDRATSMVFQSQALFPHMSACDNVAFGLRERQLNKREIDKRVHKMLDLIELQHIGNRMPTQLSGGQQQRVALARSLVLEPAVLLLDEPLGALDLQLRRQMQIELKSIQQQLGITFVYVTHDQEEALVLSDQIVVMRDGRVEQQGSPADVFDRPATRYVAGFMGTENVLPVEIVSHDSRSASVHLAGRTFTVPQSIPADGDLRLVIRATKIQLGTEEGWQGTVSERVYKGSTLSYRIELTDGTQLVADVPLDDDANRYEAGETVIADFRRSNALLVPA